MVFRAHYSKGTSMKKIMSCIALATLSQAAVAAYHHAPPAFNYKDAKAVFVDFEKAEYVIHFDVQNKTVNVESTIELDAPASGYAIFDLVAEPSEILIDGVPTSSVATQDPDKQTTLRILQDKISRGSHELTIRHKLSTNVIFGDKGGVAAGFWTSDLNDRRYLEQYLPTNLEFDQYKMKMKVNISGSEGFDHVLKANGKVSKLSENQFEVTFPEFYSASSVYFHLFAEQNQAANVQFYYTSIDGRMIPVDIYTIYDPAEFASHTKTILAELEADYGPFPHDQLVIFGNAPSGGMEYSGATITSLKALGHELFHSYHARALMPANGNAGWMDEAIARWRDNRYPLLEKLSYEFTRLAGRSSWSRMTDRMAYTEGSAFLSWIAFRMNNKGRSFKTFLRDWFERYKFTTVTTEMFREELSLAAGMDLTADFDKYIYGKGATQKSLLRRPVHVDNEYHPHWTEEQLKEMTWL